LIKSAQLEKIQPIIARYFELGSWVESIGYEFSSYHLPPYKKILKKYYPSSEYVTRSLKAYIAGLQIELPEDVEQDFSPLEIGSMGESITLAYQDKFGVGDVWGESIRSSRIIKAWVVYLTIKPSISKPGFSSRIYVKHRKFLVSELIQSGFKIKDRYSNHNREVLSYFSLMYGGQSQDKKMRDNKFDETQNFIMGVLGWNFEKGGQK
jgi:hypothetical protein